MSERIPTSEKLAQALEQAGASALMIELARAGYYDDYKSDLAFPGRELVQDAQMFNLSDIAQRAMAGEFDAQKWEADEWAESPKGREMIRKYGGKL